ncbi:MAG: hypothetical protein KAR47_09755, partial [Planctomycetes bacterium]|nr:hypothetical protein [Planctomycetota bacterium]
MKKTLWIIASIAILLLTGCEGQTLSLYVATDGNDNNPATIDQPIATLEKARDTVRSLLATGAVNDIEVIIRHGKYSLDQTLVLGLQDSAKKGQTITYKAYPGEDVVITSAKNIANWKRLKKTAKGIAKAAKGNLWIADLPTVKSGQWYFRTLYDGDVRLQRAKSETFQPTNILPEPYLAH